MCGINGIVWSPPAHEPAQRQIRAMNDAIAHRGPDGEGVWLGNGVALGHRRLSVIDLSERAQQPLTSADGRLVLICNGEIYNHRTLRREFSAYPFKSDTDIEVILPLYERYGANCVDHLVGMFAFALWDAGSARLLLARDRIGEKPLYIAEGGRTLAFSSEIKGLLTIPWVDKRLAESAIPLLLVYSSLPAPVTIYAGIRLLPPASLLVWEGGKSRNERYWRVDYSRRRRWSWPDAVAGYGDVVGRAVESSLDADVPVGVMLSGGVDSSTVAALAVKGGRSIDSFCIGADGRDGPDAEFGRANFASERLGTRHRNIPFLEPGIGDLPRTLWQYDQPISNIVALYADRLADVMRREVKVALSGNGGDEVFAGYRPYAMVPVQEVLHRLARPLPKVFARLAFGELRERVERLLVSSRFPLADRRAAAFSVLADTMLERLCTPAFAARWRGSDAGRFIADAARESNPQSLLDAALYSDLMVYHQHSHTVIPDIAGMRYGLEIRSPFLNHRIVEFAASLPNAMLIPTPLQPSRTKEVAKRWLSSVLPRDFVYGYKMGFGENIPIARQFGGRWAKAIAALLLEGRYLELGIFSRDGTRWAIAHSFGATCTLLSFAIWAEMALFGTSPEGLGLSLGGEPPSAWPAGRPIPGPGAMSDVD